MGQCIVINGQSATRGDPAPSNSGQANQKHDRDKNGGGDGGDIGDLHRFVQGLLKTLPAPETEWRAAARIKWLQTAADIFDLIYSGAALP
jgi:hypothetical protein